MFKNIEKFLAIIYNNKKEWLLTVIILSSAIWVHEYEGSFIRDYIRNQENSNLTRVLSWILSGGFFFFFFQLNQDGY